MFPSLVVISKYAVLKGIPVQKGRYPYRFFETHGSSSTAHGVGSDLKKKGNEEGKTNDSRGWLASQEGRITRRRQGKGSKGGIPRVGKGRERIMNKDEMAEAEQKQNEN